MDFVVDDLLRPAIHAVVGLAIAAGAVWLGLTATETGQAIVTTVELVQEISVDIRQVDGGFGETLDLLNENLRLARELLEQAKE